MARIGVAILAAGQSRRFGDEDKLCAALDGKPFGLHVCDQLADYAFDRHWIIAADSTHPCAPGWSEAGFVVVANPRAEEGIGTSTALAGQLAIEADLDAVLICLADMPLIPHAHYQALFDRAQTTLSEAVHASSDGANRMPPVVFGRGRFEALTGLYGQAGARSLLEQADSVTACSADCMQDVDDPATLARLNSRS